MVKRGRRPGSLSRWTGLTISRPFRRFTLLPRSLLARTFLLLAGLLTASVFAWSAIYSWLEQIPRAQQAAQLIISVINLTRASLVSADPQRRLALLTELSMREGLRIYPDGDIPGFEPIPPDPLLRAIESELRQRFDARTRIVVSKGLQSGVFVSFSIADDEGIDDYWLMLPRSRFERPLALELIGWGGAALLLALGGAYLIVQRVTRPLAAMKRAARAIGRGERPAPLPEQGVEELAEVAHAFNQMAEDISRNEDERALILAGISHDLRTPLTRLRLDMELAGLDPDTVAAMSADIDDMDKIIGQFLDFARIATGEDAVDGDIGVLVLEAAQAYVRHDKPVRVVHIDPLPAISFRPLALRRCLNNLIDNALRHAGETRPIDIECRVADEAIQIDVADRGPGIPPDQVERLKRPFTRLENARTGQSGAGLGLAIIERTMRAHGGRFDLLARDGGGLVARLRLPIPAQRSGARSVEGL
ncbi:ATP-binding protein [Methyloversatilis thermotolerans]|uniref:ATP-binding protein n=1 Tax=Methyloversatilis thermotolerans TaxID=1346290 RepID=UPI00039B21A0|nr:ATP-binding protein [Methyloversatilis thermotolerans]